jgi:hypothetical protein
MRLDCIVVDDDVGARRSRDNTLTPFRLTLTLIHPPNGFIRLLITMKAKPEKLPMAAWISDSKGRTLPEYQLKKTDDNTYEYVIWFLYYFCEVNTNRCWIPSVEGENFAICWNGRNVTPRYKSLDLRAIPWIDGVELDGAVHQSEVRKKGMYATITDQPVDVGVARPCQFGKLVVTGEYPTTQDSDMS